MENCLVTKLKGTVDNNSLKRFNRVRVTLAYPGQTFPYFPMKGSNNGGIAGEKISGNLFADSERTIPITKELPIPKINYYISYIYNGDQQYNPNHNVSVIDLVQDNIWVFCSRLTADDILGIGGRIFVWYSVDWKALCNSSAAIVDVTTMYLEESQDDINIEDFFIKQFRRIKDLGATSYEDATAKAWFPCVINSQDSVIGSQKRILFNKQPFFNKRLFMSTDINNDRFTLYDTGSDFSSSTGYNISNPVASYNNSTDEWTYNS
jgi:hypothetical protein